MDVEGRDEVVGTVIDRLVELQGHEWLRLFVMPVRRRTPNNVVPRTAELLSRDSAHPPLSAEAERRTAEEAWAEVAMERMGGMGTHRSRRPERRGP